MSRSFPSSHTLPYQCEVFPYQTTPNPFFNNPSNHLAADTGIEIHDTEDAGDESMRIIYVDPAAEREKNKLLGIGRDKRKRS